MFKGLSISNSCRSGLKVSCINVQSLGSLRGILSPQSVQLSVVQPGNGGSNYKYRHSGVRCLHTTKITMANTFKQFQFDKYGDSSVLKLVDTERRPLQPNEVRLKNVYAGVNFIETYFRTGLYPVAGFPATAGSSGAGIVAEVGKDVKLFKEGDRLTFSYGPTGSYGEEYIGPENIFVKVPEHIDLEAVAATIIRGLTVEYLFRQTKVLKKGDVILFHAAAGGVGLIAMQWARYLGVKVIATASTQEKLDLAKKYGAWETINYTTEDIAKRVRELTNGRGVDTIYDSVGKATWEPSLDSIAPLGLIVSYGNASGPVTGVSLGTLAAKGSITVTRPVLGHYDNTQEKLQKAADEYFRLIASGDIKLDVINRYPLEDAPKAQDDLVSRKTTGSLVLVPSSKI